MQAACDLAALRQAVVLLEREVMLEGWAAESGPSGRRVLGLLMVTSWRVAFADVDGGFTAFPIFKIDYIESASSQVTMSVWYDRMQLTFDNAAIAGEVVNLLRQDSGWNAAEVTLGHQTLDRDDGCVGPQETATANDDQRAGDLATVA